MCKNTYTDTAAISFQSLYQNEPADKKIKLPSAFGDGGIKGFCLTNKSKVNHH